MTGLPIPIDTERLRSIVYRLASEPRPVGSPAHQGAAEYIERELRGFGYQVRRQHIASGGYPGFNVIAELPLADEHSGNAANPELPLFILGAHYDSVAGSPGADDNATAVAALLEVARVLAPELIDRAPERCRLWLVAFDLEEHGMVGSARLAESLKADSQNIAGMISLEMLGYTDTRPDSQKMPDVLRGKYPSIGNFIGIVGNDASETLLRHFTREMRRTPDLRVESLSVPGAGEVLPETRLSDHSPFWDHDYPALMITDTSFMRNPHYHLPSDTPETIDFEFLTKVTHGVAVATRLMVS